MTRFLFPILFPLLASAADVTELQWAICETNPDAVLEKLGQTDWEADTSRITYFETAAPSYYRAGLSFRVKEKDGSAVAIVKVRGNGASEGSERCEYDRYGDRETLACKYEARRVSAAAPWTEAQKRFVEKSSPVAWDGLVAFGPYAVEKRVGKLKKAKVALEVLRVPGYPAILEISARVDAVSSEEIYRKISDRLDRDDVRLCRRQDGKTDRLFRAMGLIRE